MNCIINRQAKTSSEQSTFTAVYHNTLYLKYFLQTEFLSIFIDVDHSNAVKAIRFR